jgi:hypothetical protein
MSDESGQQNTKESRIFAVILATQTHLIDSGRQELGNFFTVQRHSQNGERIFALEGLAFAPHTESFIGPVRKITHFANDEIRSALLFAQYY